MFKSTSISCTLPPTSLSHTHTTTTTQEKQKRLEEEKEAKAKERTMQIARMRAAQKKAQDQAGALDALRAKRAAEENERRARQR